VFIRAIRGENACFASHCQSDWMNDSDNNLPDELSGELKRLYRQPAFVPQAMDDAVLGAAKRKLHRRRQRLWPWVGAAAAAMLMVGIWLGSEPATRQYAREDIDRSGRVDILDALAIARNLQAADTSYDINGDGVVNEADVDAVAMQAVALPGTDGGTS
jgi:hypothetical protein